MATHAACSAGNKRRLSADDHQADPLKRTRVVVGSSSRAVTADKGTSSNNSDGGSRVDEAVTNLANQQMGGLLGGARNVIVNGANMFNFEHFYGSNHPNEPLSWLEEHAMRGAEFDSSARDPPPRCHPGTRTTIIQRAQDWLDDSEREKKMLWLHGPAGVGKSAIIQTLAEAESHRLGASLFFSRSNHFNKPEKVFPTIAYQLAVRDPSYKAYIAELMADPWSLDKAMTEQFRRLIIEPFAKRNIRRGSEVWIIALDGLDECDGVQEEHSQMRPGPGRHSDDYQRKIVELISKFVLEYPTVPLIWIIASRPEPHLKAVFSHHGVIPSFWEEDVPIDSDEACSDVERYLRSEFDAIRNNYPDYISSETWPSNEEFLKIANAASGHFAFASVIVLFIGDPWVANPADQLDCVLSVIDKLSISVGRQHPLAALDAIYTEILRRIPSHTWPVTRQLIAASIMLGSSPSTLIYMCNVLGITQGTAVSALRHLHSVIIIPRSDKIGHLRIKFYHASFRDYLKDSSRSHEYTINAESIRTVAIGWWKGSFKLLQKVIVTDDGLSLSDAPLIWAGKEHNKKQIIVEVRRMWCNFMEGSFNGNNYEFKCFGFQVIFPASDVPSIIEKLGFKLIAHCPIDNRSVRQTAVWLRQLANQFPEQLEQRGILSHVTLGSLDMGSVDCNRVQCDHGFDCQKGIFVSQHSDSVQHWAGLAPSTKVAIWDDDGRRCAIFTVTKPENADVKFTYILPGV